MGPVQRELKLFPQAEHGAQRSGRINKETINANCGPGLCGQSVLVLEEGRELNYAGKMHLIQIMKKGRTRWRLSGSPRICGGT